MTDTKRIRELLDRYKRMANPALRSACAVEIVDELPALLDENDLLKQCVKDTCEDMECLPSCDSYAHDECCPVANPIHAWRQLKAEVARLRGAVCLGVGWAIAHACIAADNGEDIRKQEMPEILDRAFADLVPTPEGEK